MHSLRSYIQQKTENNCGPVSIYNFLVWAEQSPSKRDMQLIKKLLNTTERGTDLGSMLNFLNLFNEVYHIRHFSTRNISKPLHCLQAGGAFFIVFDGGDNIPHVAFCNGAHNGKISLINAVKDRKQLLITKTQFKNLLHNNQIIPIFITLRKK
jgi:hypothetical protein